jgi:hypothetical protein
MDVHDRGMLYYRLLKQDINEAKRVVCSGCSKQVTEENTILPRVRCKDMHQSSWMTSSLFCSLDCLQSLTHCQ